MKILGMGALLSVMVSVVVGPGVALADTTNVTWQNRVEIRKEGAHCADDPNCFNRYHPAIPNAVTAAAGDHIIFHTRDALDADLALNSVADDLAALDLNLVHPMTGPVSIEGAKRGDVLAVTLVDIEPDQYGYTVIVPGFGFLRDVFTEPFLVNWKLDRQAATSDQMPGIRIPMSAFMGSVGVLPGEEEVEAWLKREAELAEAGGLALPPEPTGALPASVCGPEGPNADTCLRTIPPRENGGNMDVQQMQVGTTLLLPCFVEGCSLFVGDVHYAQGDGEVSGTAIEMGAKVTLVTEVLKGEGDSITSPQFRGRDELKDIAPEHFYATVGYPLKAKGVIPPQHEYLGGEQLTDLENLNEDLTLAARNALIDMIAYIEREHGLTKEQAYILSSVAVDLVIGQVVDVPNYTVSAILDLEVFEP